MTTTAIATPAPEQATLSRALGPGTGRKTNCALCGTFGSTRTISDRVDGRAVTIAIGSCCFASKFLLRRDASALHRAFTTAAAMQAGAPAAPPAADWRAQHARLRRQLADVQARAPRRTGGRR